MAKPNNKKGPKTPAPKEKVVVKKRGGCVVVIIILILLALLALLLGFHFGWWGKGDGDGDGDGNSKSSGQSTTDIDKSAQTDVYVTVSGAKYMYENNSIEIEDLVNKIADVQGKALVHITDDSATDSAMNELKSALDNAKITYIVEEDTTSDTTSST